MDALIASGIASALIAVATKLAEKGMVDPALESGLEPFKKWLTSGYEKKKAEKALQKAFTEAIKKLDAPVKAKEDLAGFLANLGLDRLQTDKNHALREQFAQAVLSFVDPAQSPPDDLLRALRWPRDEKEKLGLLLSNLRASLAKSEEWKPLIQLADAAAERDLLTGILERVSQLSSAIVNTEAGQALRVVVEQMGLTTEQALNIEKKYRQLVADKYRKHDVQGLVQVEKIIRLPLKDVYLELGLIPLNKQRSEDEEFSQVELLQPSETKRLEREMKQIDGRVTSMLEEQPRLVILGKPGSGKTISLKFITLMLTMGQAGAARLGLDAPYLPIYIRLAEFADALLKQQTLSLEAFLIQYLKDKYPGVPRQDEFLQAALQNGACMILLDGLDEVGDIGDKLVRGQTLRKTVLREVQSFTDQRCGENCSNRIVVTSRLEGYRRGDLADFAEAELSPLRIPDEVEAFLLRWFTAYIHESDPELTLEAAEGQAQRNNVDPLMDSINRSDSVKLLATNPLLLTILAIIHQTMNTPLPNRRVELYKVVADTLIRNWRGSQTERESRILKMNISSSDIFQMMSHLAFWLHENKPGGTMPLEDWRTEIAILLQGYGEPDEVKELVEEFLHHASEEVGLLTERSPGQIGFFHLTLEEYLAAVEMARQDTDFRLKKIETYWANPRWQEVLLLTAGEIKEKYTPAVLDAYLHALLDKEYSDPAQIGRAAFIAGRALADLGKGGPTRQIHKDIRKALELVAKDIDADTNQPSVDERVPVLLRAACADTADELGYLPDLYAFVPVADFAISKYPITNHQYERFLKSGQFTQRDLWCNFPKFDENSQPMQADWGEEGWKWLQKELQNKNNDIQDDALLPSYWRNPRFGVNRRAVPVVGISWYEANAYCNWLQRNWDDLEEGRHGMKKPNEIRLPTEKQWAQAAGGDEDKKRYPWDKGAATDKTEEVVRRANIRESGIARTSPVWMYPLGESTQRVMDLAGNVWEWQANYYNKDHDYPGLRGGSWNSDGGSARVAVRVDFHPDLRLLSVGFRVVVSLPSG
jgi:formylglycine-generating enzyme required for sulfatase activity